MPFVWYGGYIPEESVFEGTIEIPKTQRNLISLLLAEREVSFNRNSTKWKTSPEGLLDNVNPEKTIPRVEDQEWVDVFVELVLSLRFWLIWPLLRLFYSEIWQLG